MRFLLVGLGGFVGSVLRYWLAGMLQNPAARGSLPLGTITVNIVGCLAIGVLAELAESRDVLTQDARALLVIGLLGGFTTFSAFANETIDAWRNGAVGIALLNVVLSVTACLLAVWLGRGLTAAFTR